jgi:hypothetical protein
MLGLDPKTIICSICGNVFVPGKTQLCEHLREMVKGCENWGSKKMNLREQYKIETGKCCALDRRRECDDDRVFSTEYVEWLEKKLIDIDKLTISLVQEPADKIEI